MNEFQQQTFHCVTFSERGYACCGAADGHVYVFVNGEAKKRFKVRSTSLYYASGVNKYALQLHESAVFSVDAYPGGLVSGGKGQFLDAMIFTIG